MTERDLPAPGDDAADDAAAAAAPRAERCAACGAVRPPAVAWCTQCYARFDVPVAAEPQPATAPPVTPPVDRELGPAHPVRRDGATTPAPQEIEARAQEMLAQLAAQGSHDPRVRSVSARLSGRGPKLVAVIGGTLLLTALAVGVMAVLGALL